MVMRRVWRVKTQEDQSSVTDLLTVLQDLQQTVWSWSTTRWTLEASKFYWSTRTSNLNPTTFVCEMVSEEPRTDLCGHADRSLHLQVLIFSPSDQVGAHCGLRDSADAHARHRSPSPPCERRWLRIAYRVTRERSVSMCPHSSGLVQNQLHLGSLTLLQGLHVAAGQRDADAVDGDLGLHGGLAGVFESLRAQETG